MLVSWRIRTRELTPNQSSPAYCAEVKRAYCSIDRTTTHNWRGPMTNRRRPGMGWGRASSERSAPRRKVGAGTWHEAGWGYRRRRSYVHAYARVGRHGRVHRTGENRSGTVGTGPTGPDRFQPVQIQNFNLNSKNEKSHKILKNTSKCVESNGVKNFQIFVRLV
jgi:hypothetical protein